MTNLINYNAPERRFPPIDNNSEIFVPNRITIEWLVEQKNLPVLVQTLPPHSLFLLLRSSDLHENLELVEWIRGKPLQKILDFDVWTFDTSLSTEDISEHAVMVWVQAWLAIGKSFTAERFFELEEETQSLILTKFFTILPDSIANIDDQIRDNWMKTPDNRFFLQPVSSDGTDFEFLSQFVDALYSYDMGKAGFVFSVASLLIRQETLELAQKWRNARLADQGFVPQDEARAILFSSSTSPNPLSNFKYLPIKIIYLKIHWKILLNFSHLSIKKMAFILLNKL